MTAACPPDADLRRAFSDNVLSADAGVEAHLDRCARCRRRLDELAGVPNLVPPAEPATPRPDSPALRTAINRLVALDTSDVLAFGQPTTPLPRLAPPTRPGFLGRLNGLDVRTVLGRGGMGVVYEAHDPILNRTVAVKVLAARLAFDADAKERFLREARAAAAVTHENVVAIHAIDQADGVPFLVLQFVDGESLADGLDRTGTLPVARAAELGAAVARGLAAAHAKGVIHRDVKPANVLIEKGTGAVKLTDFGLAKVLGLPTVTAANLVAGTPAYLSPEQALGKELDARTDLYSLGVLLFAAVTGRLPFDADSPLVLLNKIVRDPPPPLDATIPEWFRRVVSKLLEKSPTRRFASAAEVADALAPQSEPAAKPPRPRAWPWVALAAVALVVAVGVAAHFALKAPAGTPHREAEPPKPNEKSDPPKPALGPDPKPVPKPDPPKPATPPFGIAGKADRFPTLAEAVAAARSGDAIELHGDGPFATDPIDAKDKSLTIRAADGAPTFRPNAGKAFRPWLSGSGDLVLDGITVDWSGLAAEGEASAVIAVKGKLSLVRCSIFAGTGAACVACDGPLTAEKCHLVADGGACLRWGRKGKLALAHVAMEGETALATAAVLGSDSTVSLTNCTVRAAVAVDVSATSNTVTPLPLTAERCAFDVPTVIAVVHRPAYWNGRPPTPAEVRATGRKVLAWTDRDSVYRTGASYLAARADGKEAVPGELTDVDGWHKYWGAKGGTAVAGTFRFAARPAGPKSSPPVLEKIDAPTGPAPADVGATVR